MFDGAAVSCDDDPLMQAWGDVAAVPAKFISLELRKSKEWREEQRYRRTLARVRKIYRQQTGQEA